MTDPRLAVPELSLDAVFELGAGRPDDQTVDALLAVQRMRRGLSLELLRRRLRDEAGPGLLIADLLARGVGTGTGDEVLTDPLIGAWCAATIRNPESGSTGVGNPVASVGRLLGPDTVGGPALPGRHLLGTAAEVPLPRFRCHLLLGGPAELVLEVGTDAVELSTSAGPIARLDRSGVHACGHAQVIPSRTVTLADGISAFAVTLEDRDPVRGLIAPDPATPLPADSPVVAQLESAWSLLVSRHGSRTRPIARSWRTLVPQRAADPERHVSASSEDAFGAIGMSFNGDTPTLAVAALHEIRHGLLGALLDVIPLHRADRRPVWYAPWRPDPRPFGGLLHGTYAFAGVTGFWSVETEHGSGHRASLEFATWSGLTLEALAELRSSGLLTGAGRAFVEGIAEDSQAWTHTPLPAAMRRAARDLALERRGTWRLRNLTADGALRGEALPAGPAPEISAAWRRRLTHAPGLPAAVQSAAEALAAGEPLRAAEVAARVLASGPPDAGSWLVLACALDHLKQREAAERLVLAVHRGSDAMVDRSRWCAELDDLVAAQRWDSVVPLLLGEEPPLRIGSGPDHRTNGETPWRR